MSLTLPPMNNHATISITTDNSNVLVTLTSPSTITTTVISLASGMVGVNPAPAVSVTGPDEHFETRLNVVENAIFNLGSTLEKFISTNNGTLQVTHGQNMIKDVGLISQSMLLNLKLISPFSQRKPSRKSVNIDICRASKDVLTKTLIYWFQMQKSWTNQLWRAVQQMS